MHAIILSLHSEKLSQNSICVLPFQFAKKLKGDDAKLHKMVQMSWTFVNDSLCTTLCLQWEPEIIAIAVMYLAAKLSKFEVSRYKKYIAYIGVTMKRNITLLIRYQGMIM